MVALPGDVARSGGNAKRAYETALKSMVEHLQADAAATTGQPGTGRQPWRSPRLCMQGAW